MGGVGESEITVGEVRDSQVMSPSITHVSWGM